MNAPLSRRDLLTRGALVAGLPWLLATADALALTGPANGGRRRVEPFPLKDVRLGAGAAATEFETNWRYLFALDPDRLLHTFRLTAGLPTSAQPLGGWEAPDNELRGHFTGHYLSALALNYAQSGNAEALTRGEYVVTELARCQAALGTGYLSAFPEELFDRLRVDKRVWAPFYTVHKIMAGLLDQHTLAGNRAAWDVLEGMGTWTERWVQPIGAEQMARVLEREYGGMNEVLYNMAAVSGTPRWQELGDRFNRERILAPLALGHDELKGLHVNTTIPQIIGAARSYELTGARDRHDAASFFWHTVTERRSYVTGGTSNEEDWRAEPNVLAKELSGYTQECCVTYNMQKLTRHVFAWTADPRAADYYERAYYNGILGVQHPKDGQKLYYVPLKGGFWKFFGTPLKDFWCCTGSMAESFAKLGDSIYFHDADSLYVNLFIPSTLEWHDKGVSIVQSTRIPEEDTARLTIRTSKPTRFALRVRVPYWAEGGSASLNGRPLEGFASPSSYFVLARAWKDGDHLDVKLPMRLRIEAMPDDTTLQAVLFGPLVLAGRLGTQGLTEANLRAPPTPPRTVPEIPGDPLPVPSITASASDPTGWLERVPGRLEFRTRAGNPPLTLVPLNRILDERYAVYWQVATVA